MRTGEREHAMRDLLKCKRLSNHGSFLKTGVAPGVESIGSVLAGGQAAFAARKVRIRPFLTLAAYSALGLALCNASEPTSGTFSATKNMSTNRLGHTATLLATGEVLVAGGESQGPPVASSPGPGSAAPIASAELYNPAHRRWTATGSMATARLAHTATLLPNGQVLVTGGTPDFFFCVATAELYNPATGQWTTTGSMTMPRCNHTATLLANGQVLIAGGQAVALTCGNGSCRSGDSLATAEIYNPSMGTWQSTGSMNVARAFERAALLQNGKVLVAAGADIANGTITALASAELFDPPQGRWNLTGSLSAPDKLPVSTPLANGNVLLVKASFYNPATGTWTITSPYPKSFNGEGTGATLLTTANVLITGFICNYNGCGSAPTNGALLYESSTNTYAATGAMTTARKGASQTLLPNGQVLVAGGFNEQTLCSGCTMTPVFLSSAELYTP